MGVGEGVIWMMRQASSLGEEVEGTKGGREGSSGNVSVEIMFQSVVS